MAPIRTSRRGKYNYSEETRTGQLPCTHCGKSFKAQGLKKHEASCKKLIEAEDEQRRFNREYEKGKRNGESLRCHIVINLNQSCEFQRERLAERLKSARLAHRTQSRPWPSLTRAFRLITPLSMTSRTWIITNVSRVTAFLFYIRTV